MLSGILDAILVIVGLIISILTLFGLIPEADA